MLPISDSSLMSTEGAHEHGGPQVDQVSVGDVPLLVLEGIEMIWLVDSLGLLFCFFFLQLSYIEVHQPKENPSSQRKNMFTIAIVILYIPEVEKTYSSFVSHYSRGSSLPQDARHMFESAALHSN